MKKNGIKLLMFLVACILLLSTGACSDTQKDVQTPNNSTEDSGSSDPYVDDGYFK